jgi:3-methyladenine DNA glycosylase/8-oxoguanine DNA glycosylase
LFSDGEIEARVLASLSLSYRKAAIVFARKARTIRGRAERTTNETRSLKRMLCLENAFPRVLILPISLIGWNHINEV